MKFAEDVDILVQIIYANYRAKDNIFSKKDFNSLYFIVVLQFNVQTATIFCQGY